MACEPGDTVGAHLCQAGQHLRAAAIEAPRLEARLLLAHAAETSPDALLRDPRAPVAPGASARFRTLVAARAARTPMAHLLGEAGFWTLTLRTTPDALIPRPDTETLIEAALEALPDRAAVRSVLDLGTGTGALLLASLSEYPGAHGIGLDRSPAAAALARDNARRNGLAPRVAFVIADWAAPLAGRFDLILSNPPYIESGVIPSLMPEVSRHDPLLALDGGPDGLDAYRAIIAAVPHLLRPAGRAILELGAEQGRGVAALAAAAGLRVLATRPDLGGIPRALVLAP